MIRSTARASVGKRRRRRTRKTRSIERKDEGGRDAPGIFAPDGMSRAEVRAVLAADAALSPPYTSLRNAEGAIEIQGMGDDTVLRVAERALQNRGREYAERVEMIDVTEGPSDDFGGYDFLILPYDEKNILLDILEGHVVMNARSIG
jgi:hypothetical protein